MERDHEPAGWTLADAASWLDPPISADRLALLVRALHISPLGRRKPPGTAGGRPAAVYDIGTLQRLHADIAHWLVEGAP